MDPNFPENLSISPSKSQGADLAKRFSSTSTFDAAAQASAIQRYGIAGRVWEAAYVLLRYLSDLDSASSDPPSGILETATTVLELGSGTGIVGIGLAEAVESNHVDDFRIILTDLPNVCPLLEENLSLYPSLRSCVHVSPLSWGDSGHGARITRGLDGRPLTHIICSDLVYFPELFAPLLRTLINLTSTPAPPRIIISYKIRSLAKEMLFWSAFGLWFAFQPVMSRKACGGWTRFGIEADAYVFHAMRRPESHSWTVPLNDGMLLDGTDAHGTPERKGDDTFELLLLMNMYETGYA